MILLDLLQNLFWIKSAKLSHEHNLDVSKLARQLIICWSRSYSIHSLSWLKRIKTVADKCCLFKLLKWSSDFQKGKQEKWNASFKFSSRDKRGPKKSWSKRARSGSYGRGVAAVFSNVCTHSTLHCGPHNSQLETHERHTCNVATQRTDRVRGRLRIVAQSAISPCPALNLVSLI